MTKNKAIPRVPIEVILRDLRESEELLVEIAERYGRTPSLISVRVKQALGITPNQYRAQHGWVIGPRSIGCPPAQVKKVLETYASGLSIDATAAKLEMGATMVATVLKTRGVEIRPGGFYIDLNLPSAEIAERYRAGENAVQLARAYKCNERTIRRMLDRENTPRRRI
jgi:uncharacterized protein (DUF433 family)